MAIYDLIDAENIRARAIAEAVDADDVSLAQALSKEEAPTRIINELFRLSNLSVKIRIEAGEQIVATRGDSPPYSIAELSDGERNALLVAANVLTVSGGTLLIIDEPERHMHRSIVSPLLALLVSKRRDCAFVISTHDTSLPLDVPASQTILLRGCVYANKSFASWEADLIPPNAAIDEDLQRDILGARKKILFVEGADRSLDKLLYSLVFPNVSVIAKATCRDVEYAVTGIRDADDLHWLRAFGIVDNDRRSREEIDGLRAKGIYAISVFSVESIYYHPELQRRLAERHAAVTGEDANECLSRATSGAISTIRPHVRRLGERTAERIIREQVFKQLPGRREIAAGGETVISIDMTSVVEVELERLRRWLDARDLESVIERYPVRETPALAEIAGKLGFTGREQYEGAIRRLLMDDADALSFVQGLFGTLVADIEAA
jgi:hypothetical protein